MGKEVQVILGFNTREEIFYEEAFQALGCTVYVTTVDGILRHPRLCDRCFEKSQLQPLLRLRPGAHAESPVRCLHHLRPDEL